MTLYVNGTEVDRAVGAIGNRLGCGDGAALEPEVVPIWVVSVVVPVNRVSFAGEIAIFRQYNAANVLDADAVMGNYIATAGGDLNVTGVTPFEITTNPGTVTSTQGVSVTLNPDGSFVYNSGATFDNLDAGDVVTDSFAYDLIDSTGTVTLNITGTNDAPVLDNTGTVNFTGINEDATGNTGNLVSDLLDLSGTPIVTDADDSAVSGIAVTSATIDTGAGTWQYSIDGGSNWSDLGTPSELTAVLLSSNDRVRFLPDTIDGATGNITFRAWDQSDAAVAGSLANVTSNGGETAFSSAAETASIIVTAINESDCRGRQFYHFESGST